VSPPTEESRPRHKGGSHEMTTAAVAPTVPARSDATALDAPHERWQCPIWRTDESCAPIGKCRQHFPDVDQSAAADKAAPAIARALIIERANSKPDPFVAEDVVNGLPLTSNAIGGIVQALAREGKIMKVGYIRARRQSRHAATVCRWAGARWVIAGQLPLADAAAPRPSGQVR
jgi:hypothetical protein